MKKKIIINDNPWQTRIAILRDEQLQNIYFATPEEEKLERSFFKGLVTKILPGIQTAFVDIGQERAGFLHISEIDRELAIEHMKKTVDVVEDEKTTKIPRTQALEMKNILKEGEMILVQVSKEPMYEKGAKLTTCFTLPGRFIVLMPNIPRIGISKRIQDRDERNRLREILKEALPEGMGAIIRTSSIDKSKKALISDLKYLLHTWRKVEDKFKEAKTVTKIYEDIDLPLQIVRDHLDEDVDEVIIDNKESQAKIYKFVKIISPEFSDRIKYYEGPAPLFEKFEIEKQIDQALHHKVQLKSGGSIIIESTEAMTVIDVNTGKFAGKSTLEETILKANLEAAEEIVRQLRLRNIGGLIVIDFIDLSSGANRQKLVKFFEKMLRERDRFQSVVLKVSEFGIVQMTRKRSGKTLLQQLTENCPTCKGMGFVRSMQTECLNILNTIKSELQRSKMRGPLSLTVNPEAFQYIVNIEYNSILYLEKLFNCQIELVSNEHLTFGQFKLEKV